MSWQQIQSGISRLKAVNHSSCGTECSDAPGILESLSLDLILSMDKDRYKRCSTKIVVIGENFATLESEDCRFLEESSNQGVAVELWALENVVSAIPGKSQRTLFEDTFSVELYKYANCTLRRTTIDTSSMSKTIKSWASGVLYDKYEIQVDTCMTSPKASSELTGHCEN